MPMGRSMIASRFDAKIATGVKTAEATTASASGASQIVGVRPGAEPFQMDVPITVFLFPAGVRIGAAVSGGQTVPKDSQPQSAPDAQGSFCGPGLPRTRPT